ncbi:uncharacterized protein LOC131658099 [Vicia villosa]|uniref:uncharacterized protein LOC131658099 n=1 Tax=Vicia villosa TaxID=3911 RepID=UPI00273C2A2C|nr:uncharacterized protein LOC131658099 [Vicia villosa]
MERGLRQGDPISQFLFLIAVEGFNMLMKKAVDSGKYSGYKFEKGEERFTHLQYADDTLIIGEKSWSNIRTIKANLLLFEVMSGLKVNFNKSKLVGVNIRHRWLEEASHIMSCQMGSIPFKYPGLPIGANSKQIETWYPAIEVVKSKLSRWRNQCLSFGGRVVILKSVLTAIPVYFLSFFKAPAGIISKLESIFKKFLWGGSDNERRINWIQWEKVCRPLDERGWGLEI